MKNTDYIARTNSERDSNQVQDENYREQLLIEHLQNVSEISGRFGEKFGMKEIAEFLGLIHDIGKYSPEFQKRVRGANVEVDHTTAGGQLLIQIAPQIDALANCIFGHHGGLLNTGNKITDRAAHDRCRSVWARRFKKIGEGQTLFPDYSSYLNEVDAQSPLSAFFKYFQRFNLSPTEKGGQNSFTYSFLTRMLFSCLVDADFLDTEAFLKGDTGRTQHDSIDILLGKLTDHLAKFTDNSGLNKHRNDILKNCISKSQGEKGLYSLTVPTGGGKTLSSMAFALNHANKHGMERVIYVIPYTSIIEQNAKVFSDIFDIKDDNGKIIKSNVLENHSNALYDNQDGKNKAKKEEEKQEKNPLELAAENWDIPIVVTTNVQFFESLFSHKTSKTRKLHNIANSVIIFDEAQMLPTDYLKPCMYAINELVNNYRSTAVLCTATQPSLELVAPMLKMKPAEICENYKNLYSKLQRVRYEEVGELSNSELIDRLNEEKQVLCIVNTRKHAQDLYQELDSAHTFHLSTLMYPEHRREKLNEIRELLKTGSSVKVISTSLIEAGVDVDFATVYRAKTGLDSIIQAGGRCNREGKRSLEESKVYVFEADPEEYKIPKKLELNLAATNSALRNEANIESPETITLYFENLFNHKGDSLDKKNKAGEGFVDRLQRSDVQYEDVSNDFKLIEEKNAKTVFILISEEGKTLLKELKNNGVSKGLFRKLGKYNVTIPYYEYDKLNEQGVFQHICEVIVLSDPEAYSDEAGLKVGFEFKADGIFI